jgi:hypothetical protein
VTRAGICGQQPEDGLFHRILGRSHQPEKVRKKISGLYRSPIADPGSPVASVLTYPVCSPPGRYVRTGHTEGETGSQQRPADVRFFGLREEFCAGRCGNAAVTAVMQNAAQHIPD